MCLKNLKINKLFIGILALAVFCRLAYAETSPENSAELSASSVTAKITVSDMDISLVKINKEIKGIKKSIEGIKSAVEKSGEGAIASNNRLSDIESRVSRLEQSVTLLTKMLADKESVKSRMSASDISRRQELSLINEKFRAEIKAVEDATDVIDADLHQLKEDIAAGRRPSLNSKKPFKEYLPYISAGVSVIALIIAVH